MQVGTHDGVVVSSIDDTAVAAAESREDARKTVGGSFGFGRRKAPPVVRCLNTAASGGAE